MHCILLLIALILTTSPVIAQELSIMGGVSDSFDTDKLSASWQLEYRQDLGKHLQAGLSYINEGHIPNHHRDGGALQIWAKTTALNKRLSLAAGVGPYYFFDTTSKAPNAPSHNEHGWAGVASLAATIYTDSPWIFQVRTNWIGLGHDLNGLTAVAGIGYQLEDSTRTTTETGESATEPANARNSLSIFLGQTITNTFNTSQDIATSIEYRRNLARHIDWTAAWLYEADERLVRTNGLTTQLWAVRPFFDERFSIGAGGGAYFSIEHFDNLFDGRNIDQMVSGILSLTANYRFYPRWDFRTTWSRIVTGYNMDTDVIMGGIGFSF